MAQAAAQAAAAQAQVDLDGLNDCLTVCGLRTAALRNGITVREGKRSLEEFGQFQPDDIPELVKSLARNAPTTQRVYYSFTQQKNLQTLSFWVQERLATNQPLDAALWTAAVTCPTLIAGSRGCVQAAISLGQVDLGEEASICVRPGGNFTNKLRVR